MTIREMLEDRLKQRQDERLAKENSRRRKRLSAMSAAAPDIEAEAVSNAVYFMASSLVRSAVEDVVYAESDAMAAAVAKAVAEALPQYIAVDCVQYEIEVEAKDVAEYVAEAASIQASDIVETLIKSALDARAGRQEGG